MRYVPEHNFIEMTSMSFIWAVIGIVLGLLTNNGLVMIFNKYYKNGNKIVKLIIEILTCSVVISALHLYINNYFGWTWQNITPGLFFVSFYFSVQYDLFDNLSQYSVNTI